MRQTRISSLYHLQHECTPISKQVISRPYSAEKLVDDSNLRMIRLDKTARLCQDGNDRCLPKECRFTTLIRASDHVEMCIGGHVSRVGNEHSGRRMQSCLDDWMTTIDDLEFRADCQYRSQYPRLTPRSRWASHKPSLKPSGRNSWISLSRPPDQHCAGSCLPPQQAGVS